MATALYFVDHGPSNSRVLIQFANQNGKVQANAVIYIRGNVVDLNGYRACLEMARKALHIGGA